MEMFKLRIYKKTGSDKGNLDHEEFFDTAVQAFDRFHELFVRTDYSLNPTVWEKIDGNWYWVHG